MFDWKVNEISSDGKLYFFRDDENKTIAYSRKLRVRRYENGISSKLESLQAEYCTNNLLIPNNYLVIDIGANIGEFGLYWSRRGHEVIAFEPDPVEFAALRKNLPNETLYQSGLWSHETELEFFENNVTGDSSFINPDSNKSFVSKYLKVSTLDSHCNSQHYIGLIKLEAEGAEPEIIQGATETLKKTLYITCDLGPERGPENHSTLVEVVNILKELSFQPIKFNPQRCAILFENNNLAHN